MRTAIHLKTSATKQHSEGAQKQPQYSSYLRDIRSKRNKNFYIDAVFATLRLRHSLEQGRSGAGHELFRDVLFVERASAAATFNSMSGNCMWLRLCSLVYLSKTIIITIIVKQAGLMYWPSDVWHSKPRTALTADRYNCSAYKEGPHYFYHFGYWSTDKL
jgi:hypothetical protein